jgi:hypothetical protein
LALAPWAATGSAAGKEIVVGQVASLSGSNGADLGQGLKAGVEACFLTVNTAGGIRGQTVKLVSKDDRYLPEETVNLTRELIAQGRPAALIAYRGTANTLALIKSELLVKNGVTLVGTLTGAKEVQGAAGLLNLRTSYERELAELVGQIQRMILDTVAVLYADDAFGRTGLQAIEQAAVANGSKLLAKVPYDKAPDKVDASLNAADKQLAAVRERLVKEIQYWSDRAIRLDMDVRAGKQPRLQPENARRRAEELSARLKQRTAELQAMRNVASGTPNVIGGALVIPAGLLAQRSGVPGFSADAAARARIERVAMQAVLDAEHALGHRTKDVSAEKCGWDITAYVEQPEGLALEHHIEVKGRAKGQDTITVTSNEIRHGLNQKDKFVLAVVVVDGDSAESVNYVPMPFTQEPDWAEASKNLDLGLLLGRALEPKVFHG